MAYNFRTGQYEDTSAPSEVFPSMGSTPGYDHNRQFPGEREHQLSKKALETVMGQGSDSQMFGLYPGGGDGIGHYLQQILKNQQQFSNRETPKIPEAGKFGRNMATYNLFGTAFGGVGDFMKGLGAMEVAKTGRKSFEEKARMNRLNWGAAQEKRYGDVLMANNAIGLSNIFRPTQGYRPDQLADLIPQTTLGS